MSDVPIHEQPTEPHNVISQAEVDEIKAVIQDPGVQAVLSDVPAIVKETKEGYRTTEFWLTIAGLLAVNLNGVVLTLPDKYQAIASAVLAGLYAVSRGVAKKGIPAVEPAVPEA